MNWETLIAELALPLAIVLATLVLRKWLGPTRADEINKAAQGAMNLGSVYAKAVYDAVVATEHGLKKAGTATDAELQQEAVRQALAILTALLNRRVDPAPLVPMVESTYRSYKNAQG
jgi:hypothetical protein